MKADILREKYLNYFKNKKHKIVASDSLVPAGDPTVLFTPAGMNQFKRQFLGHITDFTRATSSQRCLRTDDLDKVGKTTGHHTFFEMLGNFSFGDYFKEEAISWAWEFLTSELKINEEKLWVSVYTEDEEAYNIWKNIVKIPEQKIIKLGDKDNFWPAEAKQKGPNGPCGPCSEIFYDFGKNSKCTNPNCDPACSCGRFVEIWNLVFTQFNRKDNGVLEPLPKKNIDTGMGLERVAAVLQGAKNNFETELFQPLIKEILSNCHNIKESDVKEQLYAIADHIRAITFSIFDGVLPSNESRGYVIRKLIRKSVLHLRYLGIREPFLFKLIPVLVSIMHKPYSELRERQENIAEIILLEEKNFISVLDSSKNLLKDKFSSLIKNPDAKKAGLIAFKLYDTYGIPLELTLDWLNAQKIPFSQSAFDKELDSQKERSKTLSSMKGDVFDVKELHLGVKKTAFVGYAKLEVKAKITAIVRDSEKIKKASKNEEAKIVLDKSPFYAESGGQAGDTGLLIKGKNKFIVSDTRSFDQTIIHLGSVSEGVFKVGDEVVAKVDVARRIDLARNHTGTHLLQAALRSVLGKHVKQQGSLVTAERLRFDFTHFKALNEEELDRVEEEANKFILGNFVVSKKEMSLAQAKKSGALAFFGEKYGQKVRVVTIEGVSKEFCGGTHLDFTGQIGLLKIIKEGSVASGVRRIEAVTGMNAYKGIKEQESIVKNISEMLSTQPEKISVELNKRLMRAKELEKQLVGQKSSTLKSEVDSFVNSGEEINGIKFISGVIKGADMNVLRQTVDAIKQKELKSVIALAATGDSSIQFVIGASADLANLIDASFLIKNIASELGGSGGGRRDFAQAGGNKPENLNSAFNKLKDLIKEIKP